MPLSLFVFALVQGTTEFLPVSSSGHLWWFSLLLGEDGEPYFVTSILHVVTATAAVASYRRLYWSAVSGIISGGRSHSFALRYLAALGVSGAVAAPLGLALWWLSTHHTGSSAWIVGTSMLLNGLALSAAPRADPAAPSGDLPGLTWRAAIIVGLAQGIAAIPGLSRSGFTIVAGLRCGLPRTDAVALSFALAPPIMLGAAVFWTITAWPELGLTGHSGQIVGVMAGSIVLTFVVAMLSIRWVGSWVRAGRLWWFTPWSVGVGIAVLALAASRPDLITP